MDTERLFQLVQKNFLFWLSRNIDYPLSPPDMVQVNFTFKCNLRCKMCSMYEQMQFLQSKDRQIEIDSDTFRKVIKETKELGVNNFLFIGGEPLLKNNIIDIVKFCHDAKFKSIAINTNMSLIHKCFNILNFS